LGIPAVTTAFLARVAFALLLGRGLRALALPLGGRVVIDDQNPPGLGGHGGQGADPGGGRRDETREL
jgi:hypothetical protein